MAGNTHGVFHPARYAAPIITENRRAGRLGPLSLFDLFEQLLAPDRRNAAGAMAFRTKVLAAWKPTRHPAAALADWALVIGLLSIRDHASEYIENAPPGGRERLVFLSFLLALQRPPAWG